MTNIFKIIIGQFLFGCVCIITLIMFESNISLIIIPLTTIFVIISFLFYKFVLTKFITFKNNAQIFICFGYCLIISVVNTCFSMFESDLLNSLAIIFLQSYYLADELIGENMNITFVFIIYLTENSIKALSLIPLKNLSKKQFRNY